MFPSITSFSVNTRSNPTDRLEQRYSPDHVVHSSFPVKVKADIFELSARKTPAKPLFGTYQPLKGHGVKHDENPAEVRRRQEEAEAERQRADEERAQRFQDAEDLHHRRDIDRNGLPETTGRIGRHSSRPHRNRQVRSNQPSSLPAAHINPDNPFLPASAGYIIEGNPATYPAVGYHNGNRDYDAGIIRQRPSSNLLHYFSQSGEYQGFGEA